MRIVGVALVCVIPLMLGVGKASCERRAEAQLRSLCLMINMIRSRAGLGLEPLGELMQSLCSDGELERLEFLAECVRRSRENDESFDDSWREAIEGDAGLCIPRADRESLIAFGTALTHADTEGVRLLCDTHYGIFSKSGEEARLRAQKQGKMWLSLGAAGAAAAFVMLV